MEYLLPLSWSSITNHWILHLVDKFADHGAFWAVNILPEERLHQTIRKLVINSKKDVLSTLAHNYVSFDHLQTDWSMDVEVLGSKSQFRRRELEYADNDIVPGTFVKKGGAHVSLSIKLYKQLLNRWSTTLGRDVTEFAANSVVNYRYILLDKQKLAPLQYQTSKKNNSCFVAEYKEGGRKKQAYGIIRQIFWHTITLQMTNDTQVFSSKPGGTYWTTSVLWTKLPVSDEFEEHISGIDTESRMYVTYIRSV